MRLLLRQKIYLAIATLVIIPGLAVSLFVKFDFSSHLKRELEKRGVSIAHHIARSSVTSVLSRDPLALEIAAHQEQKADEDIIYIFFLGTRPGEVLAHTFEGGFPPDLLEANHLEGDAGQSVRYLLTEQGPIYDIAVPVGRGGLGQVRLGISAAPVSEAVDTLIGNVLAVTLFVAFAGLLAGIPLSSAIAKPLQRLTEAAAGIAEGRLDQQIPEGGKDELGTLARTFNFMTRQLRLSQETLLERNRLLAAEVERRRAAEGQLASQLNFITTLVNDLPGPVFYKGTEGVYLGCNRAFEEFFAIEREKVIGRTSFDIFPESEAQWHEDADRDLLAKPGRCQYEKEILGPGGDRRQAVFLKTTFADSQGRVAGLVGIIIDVSAERQIDRMRREFVSTAAHEFQTPLTAIIGFCELLQGTTTDDTNNEREEYVGIILERAEFLSRLVDQFLDISRIEAGRGVPISKAPCHLDRLILKLLRSYRHSQGRRFDIRFPDEAIIIADEDRLTQVLENLISNALKYSAGEIVITGELEGEFFRVSVEDQGPGLNPEQLEHIFDKFFRGDSSETAPSGTGLGLYICRAIVEAHGGSIEASSIPGEGTRISFILPRQEAGGSSFSAISCS